VATKNKIKKKRFVEFKTCLDLWWKVALGADLVWSCYICEQALSMIKRNKSTWQLVYK